MVKNFQQAQSQPIFSHEQNRSNQYERKMQRTKYFIGAITLAASSIAAAESGGDRTFERMMAISDWGMKPRSVVSEASPSDPMNEDFISEKSQESPDSVKGNES